MSPNQKENALSLNALHLRCNSTIFILHWVHGKKVLNKIPALIGGIDNLAPLCLKKGIKFLENVLVAPERTKMMWRMKAIELVEADCSKRATSASGCRRYGNWYRPG
ncbi:hypothetical protein NPIL_372401 [Nephila pilipes]|uniref:Uncharacterized protein n=1 Tax=Nephila pilipes TaxID=299642 RepID=A0A8X6UT71_NEPPI|nr:hypothetical protein NPIL_372401 [Nephila pilipes]